MKVPGCKAPRLHHMFRTQQGSPDTASHPVRVLTVGNSVRQGHGRGSKDARTGKGMGPGSSLGVAAPAAGLPTSRFPPSLLPLLSSAGPRHRSLPRASASSSLGGCAVCLGPRWPQTQVATDPQSRVPSGEGTRTNGARADLCQRQIFVLLDFNQELIRNNPSTSQDSAGLSGVHPFPRLD